MNMFASLDRVLRRSLVALPLGLMASLPAHAATWELDAKESKVIFKYSFEGKPYQGEFKNVKATFDIDPLNPGACKFNVTIPIEDLAVDSKEVRDYLHDVE
ncbi:MAG TPA: YceI family protein, partial [Nitrospiraceae bacterium]|nr:YceI family protein [Nitrospiraceae bacterium]